MAVTATLTLGAGGCFRGDFLALACDRQGTCPEGATTGVETTTATTTGGVTGGGESTTEETTGGVDFGDFDAFRLTELRLIDPHVYYTFTGCGDVTEFLNTAIVGELNNGTIDMILLLDPADPTLGMVGMLLAEGECDLAVMPAVCSPKPDAFAVAVSAANSVMSPCDVIRPGTTNLAYDPPPNVPEPICVTSPRGPVVLPPLGLGLPSLVLEDAQITAAYGSPTPPVDVMVTGLITGFLPQSAAEGLQGGLNGFEFTLWETIAGGAGCHVDPENPIDDTDPNPDPRNPEPGVQMYLNFTATRVVWQTDGP